MRPGQRHLYRVNSVLPAETGTPLRPAVCLTCTIATASDNGGERRIGIPARQNGPAGGRNEWHDRYETAAAHTGAGNDGNDGREHRQAKDPARRDRSRGRNTSSEYSPTLVSRFSPEKRRSVPIASLSASRRRRSLAHAMVLFLFSIALSLYLASSAACASLRALLSPFSSPFRPVRIKMELSSSSESLRREDSSLFTADL